MNNEETLLLDWLKNHLKSLDIFKKEILSMSEDKSDLIVEYKNKSRTFKIIAEIEDNFIIENNQTLILLNTPKNFQWMINKWNKLVLFDGLTIYFINPSLTNDNKWVIIPYNHNKICDKDSLKEGLKSLFDSVITYDHTRH